VREKVLFLWRDAGGETRQWLRLRCAVYICVWCDVCVGVSLTNEKERAGDRIKNKLTADLHQMGADQVGVVMTTLQSNLPSALLARMLLPRWKAPVRKRSSCKTPAHHPLSLSLSHNNQPMSPIYSRIRSGTWTNARPGESTESISLR
jgi:hypothetical protein